MPIKFSSLGGGSAAKSVAAQAGNYTIVADDKNKIIKSESNSATIFTIADVLGDGESVEFIQTGNGTLVFEAAAGVTLNSFGFRAESLGRNSRFIVTKTSSGTYNLSGDLADVVVSTNYLVLGGGGGGGTSRAAGGGAGGYREGVALLNIYTDYDVVVGAGGASSASGNGSKFNVIDSAGGGFGGGGQAASVPSGTGAPGGSGGGGAYGATAGAGNTPAVVPAQGFSGASTGGETGGGGGGANAAGSGQTGGAGRYSSITGTSVARGGGGGGGGWPSSGPGGVGGGGNGVSGYGTSGGSGVVNTGGGGGGMSAWASAPGAGGSGIVILSYPSRFVLVASAGLTSSTSTVGNNKVTSITAGAGTVRFEV